MFNNNVCNEEFIGIKDEFTGKLLTPLIEDADAAKMRLNAIDFDNTIVVLKLGLANANEEIISEPRKM